MGNLPVGVAAGIVIGLILGSFRSRKKRAG
jgi:hypothetical protein